jgi:MerR family transcriptional regulator, copper efflux regulator
MKIGELAALTGVAERQIRFLIAEDFIPAPRGGRANADYADEHVEAIGRYTRLRDLGFPPAAIKLLLEAREGAPFPVAAGVTLVVDPDLLGSGTDVGPLIERVATLLSDLMRKRTHELDRAANQD